MLSMDRRAINGQHRCGRGSWLTLLLSIVLTGCSDILTVDNPDIVEPDKLNTPQGLSARRAGAFGDFAIAYGGDASSLLATNSIDPTQILATGWLTDELKETASDYVALDARRVQETNAALLAFYSALHRARASAEATSTAYETAVGIQGADAVISEMTSLAGFIHIFLGESFCSGVPVSRLTAAGDIEYGQPLTTQGILELGIVRFDAAIARAQTAARADLGNLARVGKARALLNLARFPEVASAVSAVPTNFRYEVKYSTNTPRQLNAVHGQNWVNENSSPVNREAGIGVDYLDAFTAGDPRTPHVLDPSGGFNLSTRPHYHQLIYPNLNSPIALATGIEARLIEAEAALQASNFTQFDAIHTALRATLNDPDVGPVSSAAMTAAQRVDFHFRERALWMWLTGHRLGDMRRLVRQYGRAADTVFPSGTYFRPVFPTYGTDTNFPIPISETNNPNFTGCIDRNP